jgi:hypothetical protein
MLLRSPHFRALSYLSIAAITASSTISTILLYPTAQPFSFHITEPIYSLSTVVYLHTFFRALSAFSIPLAAPTPPPSPLSIPPARNLHYFLLHNLSYTLLAPSSQVHTISHHFSGSPASLDTVDGTHIPTFTLNPSRPHKLHFPSPHNLSYTFRISPAHLDTIPYCPSGSPVSPDAFPGTISIISRYTISYTHSSYLHITFL